MRIAVCGGVYSNPYALSAFVADARARGAQQLYCLGDLGGYGAEPEAVWRLLTENGVRCIAGNYDVAIAAGAPDCGCGYQDPRDREYAQVMYEFTLGHTSREFAAWMGGLPTEERESLGGCTVHFVHGSPLALNDFWWQSLSAEKHAARVSSSGADVIFCTHSGLPWIKRVNDALAVNVGVIGRPPNDGNVDVRYAIADLLDGTATARIIGLRYDWRAQARSMRAAGLPDAFTVTNETGWWATCLEVLPADERSRGHYHVYDSNVSSILDAAGLSASAWPDQSPELPVRSLAGSPLLPDRIWLADPALRADGQEPGPAGPAAANGDIRLIGQAPEPPVRRIGGSAGLPLPELTLSRSGWHWHPAMLDVAPFLPAVASSGTWRQAPVKAARQTAIRVLLEQLQQCGALTPPRYCVS